MYFEIVKKEIANIYIARFHAFLPQASLPTIIKNMLETDLVMSIVETFHHSLVVEKSSSSSSLIDVDVTGFLMALSKTNRFDMAVMFLASKDKKTIGHLLDALPDGPDKSHLRKKFGL